MSLVDAVFDRGPRWLGALVVAGGGYLYARRRFNHRFRETTRELKERDGWGEDQVAVWQEEQIRSLLLQAFRGSSFYRDRFLAAGLDEADLRARGSGFDRLRALPLLDRGDVAANPDTLLAKDYGLPVEWHRTSGTTGQPLRFVLPRELRWSINFAHLYRFYAWHGFKLHDARATLGGRYLGRNPNGAVFRNPFENQLLLGTQGLGPDSIGRYAEALKRFRPRALQGHPSAITRLVALAGERGLELPPLEVVFVTGETLRQEDSVQIETAFQAPLVSFYGHGEMCVMAAQCEGREGFHVDPFFGYVELVDHPSGFKEIVATSLLNDAMPFLRYRTGDLVAGWLDGPCPCGRGFRRLDRILGRLDDTISNAAGQPVLAVQIRSDLNHAFADLPPYTIVQSGTSRRYLLRLYSDDPEVMQRGGEVVGRLRHWLGDDAEFAVERRPAADLHRTSGKHKTVLREPEQ